MPFVFDSSWAVVKKEAAAGPLLNDPKSQGPPKSKADRSWVRRLPQLAAQGGWKDVDALAQTARSPGQSSRKQALKPPLPREYVNIRGPLLQAEVSFLPIDAEGRDDDEEDGRVRLAASAAGRPVAQRDRADLKAEEMRQEFRRLAKKYGDRARRLKMCQWVPDLLGEAREATTAAPSPHPLRVAVCMFIVERLLDNSNLPTAVRTELFSAIYHNGECLDDLQASGVSSSILDVMLHAESTQYFQKKHRMDLKSTDTQLERLKAQLDHTKAEARLYRRLALSAHLRAWREAAKDNHAARVIEQYNRVSKARVKTRVLSAWRQYTADRREERVKEERGRREKALREEYDDEMRELKKEYQESMQAKNDVIESLEEVISKLRDTINMQESESSAMSPTASQQMESSKRCSELEAKLKHTIKELKESTLKLVEATRLGDEYRSSLVRAYNLAVQQLEELCPKKKKGITARVLARAALDGDHDLDEPIADDAQQSWENYEWSASQLKILGHARILNVWGNHILRELVPRGRALTSSSAADGELLIRITDYIFKEEARLTDFPRNRKLEGLLDDKSLPDRMQRYIDVVRSWSHQQDPHVSLDWLVPERILQMDPFTTNLLLYYLFEKYTRVHLCFHVDMSGVQTLRTDGLQPPSVTQLYNACRLADQFNASAMQINQLLAYLRWDLFSGNVSLGPWSLRRTSMELAPAAEGQGTTKKANAADGHEAVFSYFKGRLKDVYMYYSNMSIAYEGMLLSDWMRLMSDLFSKAGAGKEEQRLEQMFQNVVHNGERRRPKGVKGAALKGASYDEFEILLAQCGELGLEQHPKPPKRRVTSAGDPNMRPKVAAFVRDVAERAMRLEVRYHRANYEDVYTQMAVQAQSKALGTMFEFFSARDPFNRGNITTLNMDEWLKMCKELELVDSTTSRNDAVLFYNIVQEPDEQAMELNASEFLEATYLLGIARMANPLITPSHRFTLFCVERLYPLVRRKFPMIKV